MNFFFFPNQTLAGQGHIDLTEQDKAMAWLRLDSCSHQTLAHFTCHIADVNGIVPGMP